MTVPPGVLRVEDLCFSRSGKQILFDIGFDVRSGEIVTVMGPSGCGKTTLLRVLVGLDRPDRGRISILGQELERLDEDELNLFRRRLGMCFQFGALLNSHTVYDNLALPLREACAPPEAFVAANVRTRLAMVGLSGAEGSMPSQLSGGMRKRAGLARALMLDPEILLFDEPTSGLDPQTAAALDRTILELRQRLETSILVVTHDLMSAQTISDRLIVMFEGRIVAQGSRREILESTDPEIRSFVQRVAQPPQEADAGCDLGRFLEGRDAGGDAT